MHDPDVVVFDIPVPIPGRRYRTITASGWSFKRRRFTGTGPKAGTPIDPWWRPRAWEATIPGQRIGWRTPITVWHSEPRGADSGTVCKGMGGSDLTLHNVRWAWQHRAHLEFHVAIWRQFKAWRHDRCDECGKGFRWKGDARIGTWGGDKVWHSACHNVVHLRRIRDDLVEVVRFTADDAAKRRVEHHLAYLDRTEAEAAAKAATS